MHTRTLAWVWSERACPTTRVVYVLMCADCHTDDGPNIGTHHVHSRLSCSPMVAESGWGGGHSVAAGRLQRVQVCITNCSPLQASLPSYGRHIDVACFTFWDDSYISMGCSPANIPIDLCHALVGAGLGGGARFEQWHYLCKKSDLPLFLAYFMEV